MLTIEAEYIARSSVLLSAHQYPIYGPGERQKALNCMVLIKRALGN